MNLKKKTNKTRKISKIQMKLDAGRCFGHFEEVRDAEISKAEGPQQTAKMTAAEGRVGVM